ncbi:hypothetical protein NP511_12990 [Natrinema thermotolerans]|uniref:DUF7344 domain-containing protein n=1 Tax=Natrinema thermotolerans TaxID=121872 RepID=A0AAF0SXP1_9EURY|nr:hypothetical protein [Natrinema thermotolerans]ELZ18891.1 hypothetical protein C478_00375 [Natrinema thermotolerans DSM 11552]QCC59332.1 hypothetical protein DVR14_12125 [Natrinema thermotolerans]WMT06301.1 hypothetical protein NP511_12990 [Natrinema thermotolerans]
MPTPNTAPPVDVERFVRLTNVPLDEAYTLLANPRTRLALHALSAAEPPVSVTELAAVVADRDGADERTVEASLVHVVLPKLAGADVLEYDGETGRIRLERPVVAAADPFTDPSLPDRSGPNASP